MFSVFCCQSFQNIMFCLLYKQILQNSLFFMLCEQIVQNMLVATLFCVAVKTTRFNINILFYSKLTTDFNMRWNLNLMVNNEE